MPTTFKILVKTNLRSELRQWQIALVEVGIIFIFFTIIVINPLAKSTKYDLSEAEANKTEIYELESLEDLSHLSRLLDTTDSQTQFNLAYAPANSIARHIAERIRETLNLRNTTEFKDEHSLRAHFDKRTTLAGLLFNGLKSDDNGTEPPDVTPGPDETDLPTTDGGNDATTTPSDGDSTGEAPIGEGEPEGTENNGENQNTGENPTGRRKEVSFEAQKGHKIDDLQVGDKVSKHIKQSFVRKDKNYHLQTGNSLAGKPSSGDRIYKSQDVQIGNLPSKLQITLIVPSSFRTLVTSNTQNNLWLTRATGLLEERDDENTDLYIAEGILQLQHLIFREWYRLITGEGNVTPPPTDDGNGIGETTDVEREFDETTLPPEDGATPSEDGATPSEDGATPPVEDGNEDTDENRSGRYKGIPAPRDHKKDGLRTGDNPPRRRKGRPLRKEYKNDGLQTGDNQKARPKRHLRAGDGSLTVNAVSFNHLTHSWTGTSKLPGTSNLIGFLYSFAFLFPFLHLIWRYARERQENMLEHHWKYGYEYTDYWWAHIVVSLLHFLVLAIIIVILVMIPWTKNPLSGVFFDANPFVLLFFLMLYCLALIVCTILIVVTIVNAVNCVLFGLILWIAAYSLFSVVVCQTDDLLDYYSTLFGLALFFNNVFPCGMLLMKNVNNDKDTDEIWILIVILIINIFVQLFLFRLIQCYYPGHYREPKNAESYAKKKKTKFSLPEPPPSYDNFEYGSPESQEAIRLKNVCTYYKLPKGKRHLKNISMQIYLNEVTVIHGHHSSGKTTLICLMAGWRYPRTGYIYHFGKNINLKWKEVRNDLDVCMPNNTLFDILTVIENLQHYIRIKLKAQSAKTYENEVELEVGKWWDVLSTIIPHKGVLVKNMTFEQKRLLCLCCTLSCKTKIVLLDEPTLHMRARERSMFWNILESEKRGRAIVVTTFSNDVAEAHADRLALLENGQLKAFGTQLFLKTKYLNMDNLIIMKRENTPNEPITELVLKFIPSAQIHKEVGELVFYKLPKKEREVYQHMLLHLEKESPTLGIVHLRLLSGELSDAMSQNTHKSKQILNTNERLYRLPELTRKALHQQQLRAMLHKKLIHQASNFWPILMLAVALFLIFPIREFSKVLVVSPDRLQSLDIGYRSTETTRLYLSNMKDCDFVEIVNINTGKNFVKLNLGLRGYTPTSLVCGKGDYGQYLMKEKKDYDNFGAVSLQKDQKNYTIWINQRVFHSAPLALNLLQNLLLEDQFDTSYLTTMTINPMPVPLYERINLRDNTFAHQVMALFFGIIAPLTISFFIFPLVEERRSHTLFLQTMGGVRMRVYWFVSLIWDMVVFFVFTVILMIFLKLTILEGYSLSDKLLILLLLNIYGCAALAMTYFISLFFYTSLFFAYLVTFLVHLSCGLFAFVVDWDVFENNAAFYYLISLVSPTYPLLDGISNIYAQNKEQELCRERCDQIGDCSEENMCDTMPECCVMSYIQWQEPGVVPTIVFMTLAAIIYIALVFVVDIVRMERRHSKPERIKQMHSIRFVQEDADIVTTKVRLAEADLRDLRHIRVAVDQLENRLPRSRNVKELQTISFQVDRKQCLVIYGPSRCGKSHVAKQLVGEHGYHFGEIYMRGYGLREELEDAQKFLGYCPQDYGLLEAFTPNQLLRMYCLIRGVPPDDVAYIVNDLATALDMLKYINKKVESLSVEKRRKVNIAISLVVSNKIVVLDEPTRGMPAHTCREIWSVIQSERSRQQTFIVISSESSECEAIADKIIIFRDYEMLAFGNVHYIRERYTKGFYLEVKVRRDGATAEEADDNLSRDIENLGRFVYFLHEHVESIFRYDNQLRYYVPVENIIYSNLYGAMEKNRRRLNISDYTVSQGTIRDAIRHINAKRKELTQI